MAAASVLAVALAATPGVAEARIDTATGPNVRHTVQQSGDWETMSNLPARRIARIPGYGFRAGFCVNGGVRWDSGRAYGYPWGNVEGQAWIAVDGPGGECTVPSRNARVAIEVSPIVAHSNGHIDWLANRGCVAAATNWGSGVFAWTGQAACSAPTTDPHRNYLMAGYSILTVVDGQVFPDQASSTFQFQWANWPSHRI